MDGAQSEIVNAYIDAWNRRDLVDMASLLDGDVRWERSVEFPEGRVLSGSDEVIEFARSMFEVFDATPIQVHSCVEGTEGRVVVVGTTRFLGKRSEVETRARWTRVYTVRGGRITRIDPYNDSGAALRAADAPRAHEAPW
jgi:ketosteroid isomerase-like protein